MIGIITMPTASHINKQTKLRRPTKNLQNAGVITAFCAACCAAVCAKVFAILSNTMTTSRVRCWSDKGTPFNPELLTFATHDQIEPHPVAKARGNVTCPRFGYHFQF